MALIIAVIFLFFSLVPPYGNVRMLQTGIVYCVIGAVAALLALKKLRSSSRDKNRESVAKKDTSFSKSIESGFATSEKNLC